KQIIEAGTSVVVADLNEEKLVDLEKEHGNNLLGVITNVTKDSDIKNLLTKTIEKFGHLDYAFNVAGASKAGAIIDQREEDWDFTVDLCFNGVFLSVNHEA